MTPIVSVIIPAFNIEKYIERSIESLQEQSFKDIEIIVVNDCSTDSTLSILNRLMSTDSRIKVYSNEKNMGPMWNRDYGTKKATGRYIMFCDGDDTFPPEAIEHLYNAANERSSDVVAGSIEYVYTDGKREILKGSLPYGNLGKDVCKALLYGDFRHELWGKIYSASLFKDYNYKIIPNFTNNEDEFVLYQLVKNIKNATVLDEVIYVYYQVEGSSTQKKLSRRAIDNIFYTQKEKNDLYSTDESLSRDVKRSISMTILPLYCSPHRYDRQMLKEMCVSYGVEDCLSFKTIWNCFTIKEIGKIYLKILLQSVLKLNFK